LTLNFSAFLGLELTEASCYQGGTSVPQLPLDGKDRIGPYSTASRTYMMAGSGSSDQQLRYSYRYGHQLQLLLLLYQLVLAQSYHSSSVDPFVPSDGASDHKTQGISSKHSAFGSSKQAHQRDFEQEFCWRMNSMSL